MKRNGREIRSWMVGKGITVVKVAQLAKAQQSHVSHTIYGNRNHRRTLKVLVDMGCPIRILALSEELRRDICDKSITQA